MRRKYNAVSSLVLSLVKGIICLFDRAIDTVVFGMQRYAEGHRYVDGMVIEDEAVSFDNLSEIFSHRHCILRIGIRKQEQKFLPAPASDHIILTQPTFEQARKSLKHIVSASVPIGVVDSLEVINVCKNKGKGSAFAGKKVVLRTQGAIHATTVWQPG